MYYKAAFILVCFTLFNSYYKLFSLVNEQPLQIANRWICLTFILVSCYVIDVSVKAQTTYLLGCSLENINFFKFYLFYLWDICGVLPYLCVATISICSFILYG